MDARLLKVTDVSRVEIRELRILPGHAAGSILAGSAVFQIEGQPESVLRPGDVFFEPEGERIARFDATDEGVTFLGYFLLSPGQDASITMLDQ
jgi:quercetin dioxygenase-like cupin family protein